MLKLISLNYTVMLNGYSQWLNIRGKNYFIETLVVLVSVILAYNQKKMPLNKQTKNTLSLCCLYINLKIEYTIIAI